MKILNIDIKDKIELKNIEDNETGLIKFVKNLKIPADNYNNILVNFNILSPDVTDLHLFAIFSAKGLDKPISMEITKHDKYNNSCYIPNEILAKQGLVALGVYGYSVNADNSLKERLSLEPVCFTVINGSYNADAVNSIVPTPTVFEEYFNKINGMVEDTEDLISDTKQEIDDIFRERLFFYKMYEGVYVTKLDNEDTILIDISNYNPVTDMLMVDIEGLDLAENVKYTKVADSKKIKLTYPVDKGTSIHYRVIKTAIVEARDYDYLKGCTGNYEEYMSNYTTTAESTDSFDLPSEYNENSIVNVYVDGKITTAYSIVDNKVVLSSGVVAGTEVVIITKNVENIEDLKSEINYLQSVNNMLINDHAKIPFSGESNHIVDSGELPIQDIKVNASIKQNTREGYNLYNTDRIPSSTVTAGGVNFSKVEGGGIKANGTATGNKSVTYFDISGSAIANDIPIVVGKKLYVSAKSTNTNLAFAVYIKANNTYYELAIVSNNEQEITIPDSATAWLFRIVNNGAVGQVFNNDIIYPMISETRGKEFEQYGAMPSKEFPSDVLGSKGIIENVIENKNIAKFVDKNNYIQSYAKPTYDTNILNYIKIVCEKQGVDNAVCGFRLFDLTNYAGKTLSVKVKVKSSNTKKGFFVIRQNTYDYKDATKTNEKYDENQKTNNGIMAFDYTVASTITDSNKWLFMSLYCSRGETTENIGDYIEYWVEIKVKDNQDEMVNHQEQVLPLDLKQEIFDKDNANIIKKYINNSSGVVIDSDNARSILLPCKPNTTYTILKTNEISKDFVVGTFETTPKVNDIATKLVSAYDLTQATITSGKNDTVLMIYLCWNQTTIARLSEILDSVSVREYRPVYNADCIVELTDAQIAELGLEKAEAYFRDEYGKYVFTGNEAFSKHSSTSNNAFYINPSNNPIKDAKLPANNNINCECYSNNFSSNSVNNLVFKDLIGIGISSVNDIYCATSLNGISTVEDFKAWVQEQYNNGTPLYVVYKLFTPKYTPIKDETLLKQYKALRKAHSYKEVTNINSYATSEESAPLGLSGNALMSNDIRLAKLEKLLNESEV